MKTWSARGCSRERGERNTDNGKRSTARADGLPARIRNAETGLTYSIDLITDTTGT